MVGVTLFMCFRVGGSEVVWCGCRVLCFGDGGCEVVGCEVVGCGCESCVSEMEGVRL